MISFETQNVKQTQKIARLLAEEVQKRKKKGVRVIALEGELGSGKTTFVQGFARALGIKEKVLSPTFVLIKIYAVKKAQFRHLIHIDCYRIDSPKDLLHLGFDGLLKDKDAIILIEWADRVKKLIPPGAIWIRFRHGRRPNKRIIEFL
jgi:tRNA threonylcarbamoyladenosine biosynthesis protein TsaE